MKKKVVLGILIIVAFTIVFICKHNGDDLRANGILTTGLVTNAYPGTKGGINLDYMFWINGKKITGSQFYFISSKFADKFQDRYFPVMYSKSSPDRNSMLILQNNFSDFNIEYPDSLKWVLKYKGI
jgi:hypothetical protein